MWNYIYTRESLLVSPVRKELDAIYTSTLKACKTDLLQVIETDEKIFIGTLINNGDSWLVDTESIESFPSIEDATAALIEGSFTFN